jgi:hypothetical protein
MHERMDLTALAEWDRLERRCCPFFDFNIEVEGDEGPTWLTLSGPSGVKEFIRLEIGVQAVTAPSPPRASPLTVLASSIPPGPVVREFSGGIG